MTKPHKCPSCQSPALVLFTTIECTNRQCRHWDRTDSKAEGVVKHTFEMLCCGVDMIATPVVRGSYMTLTWSCPMCGRRFP